MEAGQVNLQKLLNGNQQYVVSVFQRDYSWRRLQWQILWSDIEGLYKDDAYATQDHFLGAIVTLSLQSPVHKNASFLLIDGQQRFTTLCLLLAAMKDTARERGESRSAERINYLYLENQYVEGDDRLKVLSTHPGDRAAFKSVMESPEPLTASPIVQAYRFFLNKLRSGDLDLERLETVVLSRLSMISISLGSQDNPHRIFESLNAKSVRLGPGDLLRNYFFMRLPVSEHEHTYVTRWEPMQDKLGTSFDEFIRDVLVKDGQFVKIEDVYRAWKARLDPLPVDDVRHELEQLCLYSTFYRGFLHPEEEQHQPLRKRLVRLNRWGGTTTYPFLMNLWLDAHLGRISKDDLAQILLLIESFLVRRLFAYVPTNQLNRLFIGLYAQLPEAQSRIDAVWDALSKPGHRWPTDEQFATGIIKYPLYKDSRPDQRKLILEALEESFGHREHVDLRDPKIQIEHIMPQNLTDDWRSQLGSEADKVHQDWLHSLGNLTLTAYNPELSNSPFETKRQLLRESHFDLNKEIAALKTWTESDIRQRAFTLAKKACQIWPGPKH